MMHEHFAMFQFKVEPCPQKNKHPWDSCIYCHPQENARRRDVRSHKYLAEACPDYKVHGFCALGNDCPFAHGVFEINLHPSKYCTAMCTEGNKCRRRICFFAHSEAQLRQPDYSYGYNNAAEAELVKETLLARRKLNAQMLQTAPATPPQGSPPRLFSAQDRVAAITDAFRQALPGTLPTSNACLPGARNSYSLPLLDINGDGAWSGNSSMESLRLQNRLGVDSPLLPEIRSPAARGIDLAAVGLAHSCPPNRSLPNDSGPRISMKVRRELGLEPAKPRTHSLPHGMSAAVIGGMLPNAGQARCIGPFQESMPVGPRAVGHLPSATSTAMTASAALAAIQQGMPSAPGMLALQQLPPVNPIYTHSNTLPALTAKHNDGRLMVVSPTGLRLTLEEAINHCGFRASGGKMPDLSNLGAVLGNLDALGYRLCSDHGSKAASEMEEDRSSGKSTPDFHSNQGLTMDGFEFPFPLNLGHGNELLQTSKLAGLSHSVDDLVQCN